MFHDIKSNCRRLKCAMCHLHKLKIVTVGKSLWCKWNNTLQTELLYKNNTLQEMALSTMPHHTPLACTVFV